MLYRSVRWGSHLELFLLDTRRYRDANLATDDADRAKTLLGPEQLHWLEASLKASDATWKVIVSSVPISIPTGKAGRDGWADFVPDGPPQIADKRPPVTGFERELIRILHTLEASGSRALFITTDVHFAAAFRYTPFAGNAFQVHEIVVGPGNAGLFPNREFDRTLGTERLFFYGPATAADVTTWGEARKWFNYGVLDIDGSGALAVHIRNTSGETVYTLDLPPPPGRR